MADFDPTDLRRLLDERGATRQRDATRRREGRADQRRQFDEARNIGIARRHEAKLARLKDTEQEGHCDARR